MKSIQDRFPIGQKVRVYGVAECGGFGGGGRSGFHHIMNGSLQIVKSHHEYGWMDVQDGYRTYYVHHKQCRRLTAKREPREIFITLKNSQYPNTAPQITTADWGPYVEGAIKFIEVINK